MMTYVYDGSFEGLLTAIYDAYYRKQPPNRIVTCKNLQQDMFEEYIYIQTDKIKSRKVYTAIYKKISAESLKNVFYAFLSENAEVGTWIYEYLKLGWKIGKQIDFCLQCDKVLKILSLRRKVSFESHRMLGLIRFKTLKNHIYYTAFEPDYNIIGLIAPHFAERFKDQNWIIHDIKRNTAAMYNKCEWIISPATSNIYFEVSKEEKIFQKLWTNYFHSIAIKSRKNSRLQKQYMPMKYWKHLTEIKL